MQIAPVHFNIGNRDGSIRCEFYKGDSDKGVIYMHGVGGGTRGPSNIYHPLAEDLQKAGISSLLIDCRHDTDLGECISDVEACIDYLDREYGIREIGLIGWSFGGAVVISAAARDKRVKTVITVASQSAGTGNVGQIAPRPLLLIHGIEDKTLSCECSVDIAKRAGEPRKLVLFEGADHGISQCREKLFTQVRDWFLKYL